MATLICVLIYVVVFGGGILYGEKRQRPTDINEKALDEAEKVVRHRRPFTGFGS